MVAAMVLGGLRRCEVLGLRLEDLRVAERRVFVAEGKGGHQRLIPVSRRFFDHVAAYLDCERPAGAATDYVFVVLKGPNRGKPLTANGLDELLDAVRRRAGLAHATCHELRHTCLTRLREAGMALEAVQAQAGHASIESTRHLPAPGRRLAGVAVPQGGRGHRRAAVRRQTGTQAVRDERAAAAAHLGAAGGRRSHKWWPRCAATCEQVACVLRPGSVVGADLALRSFAAFLVECAPDVHTVADVARRHVEDYKPWLAARPGQNKPRVTPATMAHRLGTLRMFFVRIDEWGWDEAPARVPMFNGDLPEGVKCSV